MGVGFAAEANYQKPSNRIISNLTGGRFFSSDGPAVRIPAGHAETMNRIIDALPTRDEAAVIFDRIEKVVPVNQVIEMGMATVDHIAKAVEIEQPAMATAQFLLSQSVMASGLSPEQKAIVMGHIQENTTTRAERGTLPTVQVLEKTVHEVPDHPPSQQER